MVDGEIGEARLKVRYSDKITSKVLDVVMLDYMLTCLKCTKVGFRQNDGIFEDGLMDL